MSLVQEEPSTRVAAPTDEAADGVVTVAEEELRPSVWREMWVSEDWWAVWCGGALLVLMFALVWFARPADFQHQLTTDQKITISNPLKPYVAKPGKWTRNPADAFVKKASSSSTGASAATASNAPGLIGIFLLLGAVFALAAKARGQSAAAYLKGYWAVFLLALGAYVLSGQTVITAYNLEYALWALLVGLIISNTVGTPAWMTPAVQTEFYIKTGLVLLGAEVLMSRLLALGLPGIFVSWVVTPIVLVGTFIFGQRVLKMKSPSLNMVISADMSVCGVSAAIATAAACKAKKEELTLAVGLSLTFTVLMMVLMPAAIKMIGMDEVVAGAWLGGTIDSTGAVAAAGAVLGERALETAATVKMIQNILIGVIAFFVAIYWVSRVERNADAPKPSAMEIWYRFPKFVLGFIGASVLFSFLYETVAGGPELINSMIDGSSKVVREWLFCLAFVSIGLATNFRELMPYLRGGKPLVLYVCGQTLNLVLTLLMAWLMFGVIFKDLAR